MSQNPGFKFLRTLKAQVRRVWNKSQLMSQKWSQQVSLEWTHFQYFTEATKRSTRSYVRWKNYWFERGLTQINKNKVDLTDILWSELKGWKKKRDVRKGSKLLLLQKNSTCRISLVSLIKRRSTMIWTSQASCDSKDSSSKIFTAPETSTQSSLETLYCDDSHWS